MENTGRRSTQSNLIYYKDVFGAALATLGLLNTVKKEDSTGQPCPFSELHIYEPTLLNSTLLTKWGSPPNNNHPPLKKGKLLLYSIEVENSNKIKMLYLTLPLE